MQVLTGWRKITFICALALQSAGPAMASMGGVSGGGGNVIQREPVRDAATVTETVAKIHHAVTQLPSFLAHQKRLLSHGQLRGRESELYARLLKDPNQVYQIISGHPVAIEPALPCLTADAQNVDGSIYGRLANTVCISAKSISEKLNFGELGPQATALLVHEYSELNGFNEAEAYEIQTFTLRRLLDQQSQAVVAGSCFY